MGSKSADKSAHSKKMAVAEGLEPSIAGLTIRCLTNLATPQKESFEFRVSGFELGTRPNPKLETRKSKLVLVAVGGVEPPTSRL
jgi:hypothetical protein